SREVAERLSSRESCGDAGYPFIRRRQVMRRHADGPLLRFRDLFPLRGADSFEYLGGFLSLGLELPGERFSLCSHGVLLGMVLIERSSDPPRTREAAPLGPGALPPPATSNTSSRDLPRVPSAPLSVNLAQDSRTPSAPAEPRRDRLGLRCRSGPPEYKLYAE